MNPQELLELVKKLFDESCSNMDMAEELHMQLLLEVERLERITDQILPEGARPEARAAGAGQGFPLPE